MTGLFAQVALKSIPATYSFKPIAKIQSFVKSIFRTINHCTFNVANFELFWKDIKKTLWKRCLTVYFVKYWKQTAPRESVAHFQSEKCKAKVVKIIILLGVKTQELLFLQSASFHAMTSKSSSSFCEFYLDHLILSCFKPFYKFL